MSIPGALTIVDLESRGSIVARFMPRSWSVDGGMGGGITRCEDGDIWLTLRRSLVRVRLTDLTVTSQVRSHLLDDLHQVKLRNGSPWVISTGRNLVAVVTADGGGVRPVFTLADDYNHHVNGIWEDDDGTLLVTCHGQGLRGGILRFDGDTLQPFWIEHAGYRLRSPHDGMIWNGEALCAESWTGRLLWRDGHAIDLGGWCRGVAPIGDHLVVGVNRFHEPFRGTVRSPEIAVIDTDRRLVDRFPIGLRPPLQTFGIIEAIPGDLGWLGPSDPC